MEPDTDSPADKPVTPRRWQDLPLRWRILAVNVFAVLLLAGSFFYLDSFRGRLIDERAIQSRIEADIITAALDQAQGPTHPALLAALSSKTDARLRLIKSSGAPLFDSWQVSAPRFRLIDPATEGWQRHFARWLDDVIDAIVGAPQLESFEGFETLRPAGEHLSLAPDRTHIITATRFLAGEDGSRLILDRNARDIRRLVRAERSRLGLIIAFAIALSTLLSLFLARTIVKPLRGLAEAAQQVRLGRAREVVVPRLPSRTDEIGRLARALSDMNRALQDRIDSTESFAADVAHELRNPLASLSSAAQTLQSVRSKADQRQLLGIIDEDVRRLDRLITEVAELSRLDGRLARSRFTEVDFAGLIEDLITNRTMRDPTIVDRIAFARPLRGTAIVLGDRPSLLRVLENLLDNALSFSPPGGIVTLSAARGRERVIITVEDEGPGVPAKAREKIFERFHSDRPDGSAFGQHSGLGLSIARAVIDGHEGSIKAEGRGRGKTGARFVISLPTAK